MEEKRPVADAPIMDTTTTIPNNDNNDLAVAMPVPPATNGENDSINGEKKNNNKKKRSGGFNFLKSAMLMFRTKPSKNHNPKPPAIQLDVASNHGAATNWKKIVGSMRPLHLQDNSSMPPSPSSKSPQQLTVNNANIDDVDDQNQHAVEHFEDVIAAPVSPTPSTSSTFADSPSVYGSAMNLQELDNHRESDNDEDDEEEEDEDEDQVFDNKPADAMIDAKAEEFIAHFYAQMRHQQLASACHNHHHRK